MARSLAVLAVLAAAALAVLALRRPPTRVEPGAIQRAVPAPDRAVDRPGLPDPIAAVERSDVEAAPSVTAEPSGVDVAPEPAPILLARHGTIVVALTRRDGSPPGDGWVGVARTVAPLAAGLASVPVVVEPFDAEAGICVLEGVEPGWVEVRAERDGAQPVEADPLQLEAGADADLTLVVGGQRRGRTVDVAFRLPPFDGLLRPLRRDAPITATLFAGARVVATLAGRPVAAPGEGPFTVRMEDPRFEPVTLQDVRPGQPVTLNLVGSAAVRVDVVTADGEPWEEYDLDVELVGGIGVRDAGGRVRHAPLPLPEGGRFALPPGLELELSVDAGARGAATARIEPLEIGEERAVRIALPASRFLVDVEVTRGTPAVPARDVLVGLVRGAVDLRSRDAARFATALGRARVASPRSDLVLDASITDTDGRAQLGAPGEVSGPWSVCAYVGGTLAAAPVAGNAASLHIGGVGELIVEFTGVPRGARFPPDSARLLVRAPYRSGRSPAAGRGDVPLAPDSDAYRAEEVPSGLRAVVLDHAPHLRGSAIRTLRSWHELTLAEVDVVEGRTTRVRIDAGPFLGGFLEVGVRVDGVPRKDLVVTATADGTGSFAAVPASMAEYPRRASAATDRDGIATFDWLPPSTWTLTVHDQEHGWTSSPELQGARVTLAPGATAATALDVALRSQRVVLRDASSGGPLREARLDVAPAAFRSLGSYRSIPIETDASGAVEITLPAGSYCLLREGQNAFSVDPSDLLTFEWPLPASADGVLRVPPAR